MRTGLGRHIGSVGKKAVDLCVWPKADDPTAPRKRPLLREERNALESVIERPLLTRSADIR